MPKRSETDTEWFGSVLWMVSDTSRRDLTVQTMDFGWFLCFGHFWDLEFQNPQLGHPQKWFSRLLRATKHSRIDRSRPVGIPTYTTLQKTKLGFFGHLRSGILLGTGWAVIPRGSQLDLNFGGLCWPENRYCFGSSGPFFRREKMPRGPRTTVAIR